MPTLVVRHIPNSDPPQFQVERASDSKASKAYAVPTPFGYHVQDRPDGLMAELQWYLEQFLNYPYHPETEHAERVLTSLKSWGEAAFCALFDARDSGGFFDEAIKDGYHNLQLRVISDDPKVQAWPWEALRDPKADCLAHACQVERRMDSVRDPVTLHPKLPKDQINILLVTARPYTNDVAYQSVSGPLVEMIEAESLPAQVHVLRPPTFTHLVEHLREQPGFYHVVHFDGHGSLDGQGRNPNQHAFRAEGKLVFEDARGEPDIKSVDQLGPLLREHNIPCVVLNACQSGMHDANGDDPFASVASALLKAGIRSVVAMAYSLYVSGARKFLPDFYRQFFARGSVAEGVRAGRQAMLLSKNRLSASTPHPLEDWLVPVLYQQEPLDFSFAAAAKKEGPRVTPPLPQEVCDLGSSGFVGREAAILELERALRGTAAGILIHGMGGVGKTTLAKGFLQWLARTEGLGKGAFWLTFKDIHSAEYVLNAMGGPLIGESFLRNSTATKLECLANVLREHSFMFVWDNFETVAGIPGTTIAPLLSEADRQILKDLLRRLKGGKTKVLITSRSPEEWLGREQHRVIKLGGLSGDDRWEYCQRIIDDLGLKINRGDAEFKHLMDQLGGHPLCMRAILPLLENQSAAEVLAALRDNMAALGPLDEEAQQTVQATLQYAMQALPDKLRALLYPLSLHEVYAQADFLEWMAQTAEIDLTQNDISHFFHILGNLGVVREVGQNTYELHPALSGYLRSHFKAEPPVAAVGLPWRNAFASLMAGLAEEIVDKPLQIQHGAFYVHQANIHHGLAHAVEQGLVAEELAILQCLAAYALNTLAFAEARQRFEDLAKRSRAQGLEEFEAGALHQLGRVAEEAGDLPRAREWYLKSLEISARRGNEAGAALTYHQLGIVAQKDGDLSNAREWYLKSLEIEERRGNEAGAATTYQQLGMMEQDEGDLSKAREWCLKSLEIRERLHDEGGAALTYHQLGMVAQLAGDLPNAREWYLKSLEIKERRGNEAGAALSYAQLGTLERAAGDGPAAKQWFEKALRIFEKRRDNVNIANVKKDLASLADE